MERTAAITLLAPVHARVLSRLDGGADPLDVAAELGFDIAELTALVRVAEAKVERIMRRGDT